MKTITQKEEQHAAACCSKPRIAIFAYLKNLKAPPQTHFLKHYPAEFLVRDSFFVDQIVECRSRGGDPLFGKESGGGLGIHTVCLDGFILTPEVGEFRKDGIYCIADDRLQLCRRSNDNGIVHCIVSIWLNTGPRPGFGDRSRYKVSKNQTLYEQIFILPK